jgi:hypothetical protein
LFLTNREANLTAEKEIVDVYRQIYGAKLSIGKTFMLSIGTGVILD